MACKRFVGSIPIASTDKSWSEPVFCSGLFKQVSCSGRQ
jgi:hypothetical protein